jgi:hypothetical protein
MISAFSVAKLTWASSTPATAFSPLSMRAAQEAQVIPEMEKCVLLSGCVFEGFMLF